MLRLTGFLAANQIDVEMINQATALEPIRMRRVARGIEMQATGTNGAIAPGQAARDECRHAPVAIFVKAATQDAIKHSPAQTLTKRINLGCGMIQRQPQKIAHSHSGMTHGDRLSPVIGSKLMASGASSVA